MPRGPAPDATDPPHPLRFSDPVHEIAKQMTCVGWKGRTIGMSMLAEAIALLHKSGLDRSQIVKAVDDVLSKTAG